MKPAAPRKGRPKGGTTYKDHYPAVARALYRHGAVDADVAVEFGVDVRTIERWKVSKPEFAAARTEGLAVVLEQVERSLYEMAVGYEHVVQKPVVVGKKVVIVTYVERIAPNVTAQIFTLKNRDPANWRDKQVVEHEGLTEAMAAMEAARARAKSR